MTGSPSAALSLSIRNFGPIERADLVLKPLTIFVGPNNSGKSVAAMLTYSVLQALPSVGYRRPIRRRRTPLIESLAAEIVHLENEIRQGRDRARVSEDLVQLVADTAETELRMFVRGLHRQIERAFSARLEDMARVTSRKTHRPLLRVLNPMGGWNVRLEAPDVQEVKFAVKPTTLARNAARVLHRRYLRNLDDDPDRQRLLVEEFLRQVRQALFGSFPPASYYLPAERSGILQSHRALASFVVRQAPLVGIEDLQVPRMSGVVSDFISNLLSVDSDSTTPYSELAAHLEDQILNGRISIEPDPSGYPNVSYLSGAGSEFPLHRASSMVSEIAPIVLYLRYLVDPWEFLIIEEPESHLHPRSQVALAQAVTDMVAGDLRVLLTTHSDYFLNRLNNALRAETIRRQRSTSEEASFGLSFEDVAAYNFTKGRTGTVVRSLDVSPTEGVSDEEFARVAEYLYEQTVQLEEEIQD